MDTGHKAVRLNRLQYNYFNVPVHEPIDHIFHFVAASFLFSLISSQIHHL